MKVCTNYHPLFIKKVIIIVLCRSRTLYRTVLHNDLSGCIPTWAYNKHPLIQGQIQIPCFLESEIDCKKQNKTIKNHILLLVDNKMGGGVRVSDDSMNERVNLIKYLKPERIFDYP